MTMAMRLDYRKNPMETAIEIRNGYNLLRLSTTAKSTQPTRDLIQTPAEAEKRNVSALLNLA